MTNTLLLNFAAFFRFLILCACCLVSSQSTAQNNGVLRQVFENIGGSDLASLTNNTAFPSRPTQETIEIDFESPAQFSDNYGQRMRALLVPPQTGDYVFWIASDDQGALFLSSDDTPARRRRIAQVAVWTNSRQWDKYPTEQKSATIALEAGKQYYIEALQKEGGGGDNLAVRWQLPDGQIIEPIRGTNLIPYGLAAPQILTQPANTSVVEGQTATFTIGPDKFLNLTFRWQRDGVTLPEGTNSTYQVGPVTLGDSGSTFQVFLTNPQGTLTSASARLTVTPDITPPAISSVSSLGDPQTLTVYFSEAVDPTTAGNALNYALDHGAKIVRVRPLEDGRSVILATSPLAQGVNYTLTVSGVRDRAATPNTILPGSRQSFSISFKSLDRDQLSGVAEPIGPSTRRGPLVVSEIMYHPAFRADGRNLEFIELYNSEAWFTDISGFRINGEVDYMFPQGTVMPARSFLVLGAAPIDLAEMYGLQWLHGYAGSLSNSKGTIRILNRQGAVVWETRYSDESPWPAGADGTGHSIVLARPSFGQRDPRAWSLSDQRGGSPGVEEKKTTSPFAGLLINEFLALSGDGESRFVELFNYSESALSLAALALTDDPAINKFHFAATATIAAGGHISIAQENLGFAINPKGGLLLLREAVGGRIIDAIRYPDQARGLAFGRTPDGAAEFSPLDAPSPGESNSLRRESNVILNEIMFDPISGENADEYVELYNRSGQTVALGGWMLSGDIDFTFAANAVIPANGFLIIARDLPHLRGGYPHLNDSNSAGNYSGSLKNSRGHVRLLRKEALDATGVEVLHVMTDEVTYESGGRWGKWSAGGGSSLERIDSRADGRLAPNWADSDESNRSDWVTIEHTGVLDNGNGAADSLQIFLMGAGECLIDDVEVFRPGSTNLIANASFTTDFAGWVPQGNQVYTTWQSAGGIDNSPCMHLRATGRGDTGANRVRVPIPSAGRPTQNQTATIRAKVRWLKGSQYILLRMHGNWLEATGNITTARNLGTPGKSNSRALVNAPPAITDVIHSPALPAVSQKITVSARVADPDGLAALYVNYRLDPATNYTRLAMEPRGAGYFTALIPGQAQDAMLAYYIEATDNFDTPATATFPSEAPRRECLVRFGEPTGKGNFGNYHFWITRDTITRWSKREQLSNDPLDATFVYGNNRVIYNIGAQYSGSPYHAPSYNSPVGSFCDYVLVFPEDNSILGETDINLMEPGNGCCENSVQHESTAYWLADQLGIPFNYSRPVHVFANGVRRAPILMLDMQQANGDFVEQWWPESNDGDLHKIQLWFEFDNRASVFQPNSADFGNYTTTGGKKKLARYRWNWARRSDAGDINNYTNMFALHDLMLTSATGTNYAQQLEAGIDTENWIRTVAVEHLVGNNDSFAYGGGQNMYIYKPENDRWRWIIWDIDFAFSSESATASVFSFGGGALNKFMTHAPFRRAYYRALQDAVNGPLVATNSAPLLDARYQAFRTTGSSPMSPSGIKTYINSRRNYLIGQLNRVAADFRVTSSTGIVTTTGALVVGGTAPISVTSILVNGEFWPVAWTSITNWTIRVIVPPGNQTLQFAAFDRNASFVGEAPEIVSVTSTGKPDPASGNIFINEWMSSNKHTIQDPGDSQFEDWIELFNKSATPVNLGGYFLSNDRTKRTQWSFPPGTTVPPRGFLLVWADAQTNQTSAAELHLPFKLSNDGEFIGLFNPAGVEIDSVDYLPQSQDMTSGRFPDGEGSYRRLSRPTPRAANAAPVQTFAPQLTTVVDALTGSLQLMWTSQIGGVYRVEFKPDLNDPAWQPVGATQIGGGQIMTFLVPPKDSAGGFYRIVTE
ncbi:MAG: hypothetical protein EXS31_07030 [Pedosphaera sp.]|nr:hypothetical protein [Pedosphaera sp.]